MSDERKRNLICRCPACAGDGGAPPASTVSTGVGGGNFDRCRVCGASPHDNTAEYVEFTCGGGWSESAEGVEFWDCDGVRREQMREDVDDQKDDSKRTDEKGLRA